MRKILITGASGKVGKILVNHFLSNGDLVIGITRSSQRLEDVDLAGYRARNRFHCFECDLLASNSIPALCNFLSERTILPDCLINNARNLSFLTVNSTRIVSRENFLGELSLDVVIPYELTMALSDISDSILNSVVNISSQYSLVTPNLSLYQDPERDAPLHYGVAKAALNHLTKEMAVRLADRSVRVNCVAYGGIEGRASNDFKNKYFEMAPTKRMLSDFDLPGPVDFLLSDASSAITGSIITADCGWTLW